MQIDFHDDTSVGRRAVIRVMGRCTIPRIILSAY
jgi:hypothetical protein